MPNEPDNDDLEAVSEPKFYMGDIEFEDRRGYTLEDALKCIGIKNPFEEQ